MTTLSEKTCKHVECQKPVHARGLCGTHYMRVLKAERAAGIPRWRPPEQCTVPGCGAPHLARGYCRKHYQRLVAHGDPLREPYGSLEDRFWPKVDASGGPDACWPWLGARVGYGYGRLNYHQRPLQAHRVSWRIAHGEWPDDALFCCHTCDNPPCVNPRHLFLGTTRDNALDMMRKGRGRYETKRGSDNHLAKLTESQVRVIREDYRAGARQVDLAKQYGVTRQTIYGIVHRRTWRHLK